MYISIYLALTPSTGKPYPPNVNKISSRTYEGAQEIVQLALSWATLQRQCVIDLKIKQQNW